ncbi:hypothetical protein BDN72DRAFT_897895 [Pluteus cervinus]|uniref:Uncharacterized protein n=1 Tax=Pluteus cervinus TaxID=181527 RepID=A0ACD3ATW6_9AGAR|nr:hypothetical protein BDN72DRAFT_897895 [Pluteus cervinus]
MSRFAKLFCLVSLVATASAAVVAQRGDIVVRADPVAINSGKPPSIAQSDGSPDPSTSNPTDSDAIAAAAQQVDQKAGPTDGAPPSDDVPPTVVTVIDGDVTAAGQGGDALLDVLHDTDSHPDLDTGSVVTKRDVSLKKRDTYEQVFAGTGTGPTDRDASIQGTAYLTFTRLNSYDLAACEAFCDGITTCVFVNLFYEFNSDAAHNPQIKCAAYGDVHSAAEKTNFGGQQLLPLPAGKSYIQQSVGYASGSLADPPVPDGYELVFGPTNGANNAPGYMGFAFLDKYDVQACANLCNTRGPDPNGGACQYFNIWRALVNGSPTTYTCAMYYVPTDASTATNTGQGNLQVTYSRGYRRITYLPDGGFESYVDCDGCWTLVNPNWLPTSPPGGDFDAELYYRPAWAHTGHSFAILGSGFGSDAFAGTLTPKAPLNTVAGKQYLITFFQQSTWVSGPAADAAFVEVHWNGATVLTINPGFQAYAYYQVTVTAAGNDALVFHGGSFPAYDFIDDVYVFLA